MSDPKRYDIENTSRGYEAYYEMVENQHGDYVRYEDYAALESKLAEAEAVIAKTADGVKVTELNDGCVWRCENDGAGPIKRRVLWSSGAWTTVPKKPRTDFDIASVSECYSTPEAAKEARDAT